jgi:hypothetical protein
MFGTAGEIIIWMVLAALVGFATGWALRSVVAERARARLSERLEEKRHEAQDLRDELRRLRGDDDEDAEGGMRMPAAPAWEAGDGDDDDDDLPGDTAEHDEVELGPLTEPAGAEPALDDDEDAPEPSSTNVMRLDEVEWEDGEDEPRTRGDGG